MNTSDLFGGSSSTASRMCKPEDKKADKNIFGLELEVNDRNSWDNLKQTVNDNIICIPRNLNEYKRKHTHAICKPDCTAQYEIVLQAERPRNILLKLRQMNEYLSPETVHNLTAGENGNRNDCSAHIHINNKYLEDIGVNCTETTKVTELLAPYLYLLSGRDYSQYNSKRWAQSMLDDLDLCDVFAHPKIRAKYIDRLDEEDRISYRTHGERYYIMNAPTRHDTSELRFFTNKCNFDYDRIKIFLEIAGFIVDAADKYQGIEYRDCYEEIVSDFTKFMTRYDRRKAEMKKAHLQFMCQGDEGYNKFLLANRNFERFTSLRRNNSIGQLLRNIRTLQRDYDIRYEQAINLSNINVDEIIEYYTERMCTSNLIDNRY